MKKLQVGDLVKVIAGRCKGQTGKVVRFVTKKSKPKSGLWLVVEGVNMIKKTKKPNPQANQKGGILDVEAPLHISNVAFVDPQSQQISKVGFKILDESKVRFCKRTDEVIN